MGGGKFGGAMALAGSQLKFVMPVQPMGPKSSELAAIGKKFIAAGRNYEEEFKNRIGEKQALSQTPKASEEDLEAVLVACQIRLSEDETLALRSFVRYDKDPNGLFNLMNLLIAIGLPPQTLGPKGQKALPKKVLTERERKDCQGFIFKLRNQLKASKIMNPMDVFNKCKERPDSVSIPEYRFRLALQGPEFGQLGQTLTEAQVRYLVYYLTMEVPDEVSLKKLALAFTQTESEPPLAQEGAEEIKKYETLIKEQARKGTPLEIVELLNFMRQSRLGMAQIFKTTQRGEIKVDEFIQSLSAAGFRPKDPSKLI